MNQKENRRTDIVFEKTDKSEYGTVRTQDTQQQAVSWEIVRCCIWDMLDDQDQFVVLTAAEMLYHIRFIQARQIKNGIIVQAGIEKGEQTRLVEKPCSESECWNIFQEFYKSSYVKDIEKYKPVEILA